MRLDTFNFPRQRDSVVLLGAGATRGAHFIEPGALCCPPLDTDFFAQLRRSGLAPTGDARELLDFVDTEFGGLDVRMETFYSQAHLFDQFVQDVNTEGRRRRRRYEWALRYFRRVLPLLFGASLKGMSCTHHEALAGAAQVGDTFISFNYDCLLDRALARRGGRRWKPKTGYEAPIAGDVSAWCDHSGRGMTPRGTILLLKPHGSLNWMRSSDGSLRLRTDEYEARHEDELTIIPPLWQKSIEAEPYTKIWRRTRRALSSAKALFVIGYSLPETDVYTQATLRMDVGNLDFLGIANPDAAARVRLMRTLRSAVTSTTHVVEFDSLAEMAQHLPGPPA